MIIVGATSSSPKEAIETKADTAQTTPKTPEQSLANTIQSTISSTKVGAKIAYKDLKIQKADSDRPNGSQEVTASVNISDFYNKDTLWKDTGKLSAEVFKNIFASSINFSDAFVWFYGKTTDRYGNSKEDVVMSYSMDKATFAKINWSNFDPAALCSFLQQEEKLQGLGSGPSCHQLVQVQ